jgi:2,3-bisphosphoglycerate-independent phosphoglycerate mutase
MKAEAIGDTIVKAINDTAFDLVVANFANADMVGHSGKLEPTIKACEAVDAQLGRIYKAIKEKNGSWLITADHGNAEQMVDPGHRRSAHRAHHQPGAFDLRGRGSQPLSPAHAMARCATSRPRCWPCSSLACPKR